MCSEGLWWLSVYPYFSWLRMLLSTSLSPTSEHHDVESEIRRAQLCVDFFSLVNQDGNELIEHMSDVIKRLEERATIEPDRSANEDYLVSYLDTHLVQFVDGCLRELEGEQEIPWYEREARSWVEGTPEHDSFDRDDALGREGDIVVYVRALTHDETLLYDFKQDVQEMFATLLAGATRLKSVGAEMLEHKHLEWTEARRLMCAATLYSYLEACSALVYRSKFQEQSFERDVARLKASREASLSCSEDSLNISGLPNVNPHPHA
ncbi:hypothetical protein H6F89_34470 [Cyanobacteria bacterium FACHB-63]|nr:hypothetical protein [Cyanobacteria bacterium FACHB-63]